jgi:hypothetical protein
MATPDLDDLFGALFAPVQLTWKQRARRWALRKLANTLRRMLRRVWSAARMLAPWYVAVTVWVTAALAGLSDQGWRALVGVGAAGAVPMYWWLGGPLGYRSRRRKLKPVEQRVWFAVFYAAMAVWAPVGAAWTVLPPWLGVWWLTTLTVWVRWIWHHRARPVEAVTGTPRDRVMGDGERDGRYPTHERGRATAPATVGSRRRPGRHRHARKRRRRGGAAYREAVQGARVQRDRGLRRRAPRGRGPADGGSGQPVFRPGRVRRVVDAVRG